MSGISGQHRQKNRNFISHRPIFVIKFFFLNAKLFLYQYIDRRNVTKNFNPVADYTKMALRLNSDKLFAEIRRQFQATRGRK